MTLKDKINYGYLTFMEFSNLIEANVKASRELSIRIWWESKDKGIIGRMKYGEQLLYENTFSGEHMHTMMAKMHYAWSLILEKRITGLKQEQHRKRMLEQENLGGQNYDVVDRDADKLTMGERAQKYGIGQKQ